MACVCVCVCVCVCACVCSPFVLHCPPLQIGSLSIRMGLGWAKSHSFHTGQAPVMKYHRQLMRAILHGKINPAKAVNAQVISLDDAPKGYKEFDGGKSVKYLIDPHGSVKG